MDKFEVIFTSSQMPPVERIKAIEQWKGICMCISCPSYNGCAKDAEELLFCFAGKSFNCISQEKECICKQCPTAATYGLSHIYFCIKGSEMAQRWFDGLASKK